MPVEPLNLAIARADAAQQVQNIVAQADRAGRAAAGRESQDAGSRVTTSVTDPDAASGSTIREEETGGSGPYEGPPGSQKNEDESEVILPLDPEGKGRALDILA